MTLRLWRAGVGVLVVLLLAAGLTFVPSRHVTATSVRVSGTQSVVCPSQDPSLVKTTIRGSDTGDVAGRTIGQTATAPLAAAGVAGTGDAYVLSGTQELGGLSSGTASTSDFKGLWLTACTAPSIEQTFVGLVSDATHSATLLITNPDPQQASVDVSFYGQSGPLATQGSRGLTVLGNSTRTLSLAPLVGDAGPVTAVVSASEGRVATYARVTGATGADWVAPSEAAATVTTIAGVPGGDGDRTLVVTNTSDRRTTVEVTVSTTSDSFVAVGAEAVPVEAGATVSIPLTDALRGEVGGLTVRATQPVAAALWATTPSGDLAVVPSRPAFQGRSVVPMLAGSVLVATNPGTEPAALAVTMRDSGVVENQTVTVDPGLSLQVPLTSGTSVELSTTSPDLRLTTLVTSLDGADGIGVAAWGPGGPGDIRVTPSVDPGLA